MSLRKARGDAQRSANPFSGGTKGILWATAASAWAIAFSTLGFVENLKPQPSPLGDCRGVHSAVIGDITLPSQMRSAAYSYVTGYNTVSSQMSSHPCIAASGADICGRRNAVACPRKLRFGTVVEIKGRSYTCEDRTAVKYGSRFDVNCDKDESCPYDVVGWTIVKIHTRSSVQMLIQYGTADLL